LKYFLISRYAFIFCKIFQIRV